MIGQGHAAVLLMLLSSNSNFLLDHCEVVDVLYLVALRLQQRARAKLGVHALLTLKLIVLAPRLHLLLRVGLQL